MSARIILLVEDSRAWAEPLEIALGSLHGLEVAWAANGEEAARMIDSAGEDVCAVITDLDMPLMNGYELIAWLRSDPRRANLPIVVLSGDVDPAAPGRAREAGANAFFKKPYSPLEVKKTVERLIHA